MCIPVCMHQVSKRERKRETLQIIITACFSNQPLTSLMVESLKSPARRVPLTWCVVDAQKKQAEAALLPGGRILEHSRMEPRTLFSHPERERSHWATNRWQTKEERFSCIFPAKLLSHHHVARSSIRRRCRLAVGKWLSLRKECRPCLVDRSQEGSL